ncbi:sulfotransferase family protein [Mucilaginibacter frigoritolerans]|uniref:Sulfotransferase family protein n=1 Tax=Mucilaginibacter frigoritolerans TaxID=652788 RepID=A0A562TZP8_9SPHI|nr:sulfotransferase [Mucilaginibacter frigoritolerans]TWI98748.1 sulfotransferase family protein [Mucilaginibacter frigoritolerans]
MPLNNYSKASSLLHQTYLANYFVSKTSFEMEQMLYLKKARAKNLEEIVFVSGLARSGTTALFNTLYNTGSFGSLTYAHMPFLLMPNLAKSFSNTPPSAFVERVHQDGIMMNNKSPEAFDEYFWKVFLNDQYIKADKLIPHSIDLSIIEEYKKYIQLIAYSSQKTSYLSKNNNNVLRLNPLLAAFPEAKFIVLYRDPLTHAQSLLRQHIHFSGLQRQNSFAVDYMNYLGHHEFGLNQKPFSFNEESLEGDKNGIDYWLINWYNYYAYLLANFNERLHLIAFEDVCEHPAMIAQYLNSFIALKTPVVMADKHFPKPFPTVKYNEDVYHKCMEVYNDLQSKRTYINNQPTGLQ